MDGAAGGAGMHGLVGKVGIPTLGGSSGAIAGGGIRVALAMNGRTGPVARPMGSVGTSDELLRQALVAVLPFILSFAR